MKGLIFQTYIDYLENFHGSVVKEIVLRDANSPDRDSFEPMGTYPFKSLYEVVAKTSIHTEKSISKVLEDYGCYLFDILAVSYAKYLGEGIDLFGFLESLEDHVHVHVNQQFPDASLPSFTYERLDEKNLTMLYESERAMSDFGIGMIKGSAKHFGVHVEIEKEDLSEREDGTLVAIRVRIL
jgi:hypothetical protein